MMRDKILGLTGPLVLFEKYIIFIGCPSLKKKKDVCVGGITLPPWTFFGLHSCWRECLSLLWPDVLFVGGSVFPLCGRVSFSKKEKKTVCVGGITSPPWPIFGIHSCWRERLSPLWPNLGPFLFF